MSDPRLGGDDAAKLQAERDALAQRVEALEARPEKRRRFRRWIATLLVILTVAVFAAAVPGTWARRTLLDTDRYVATVAPLAKDSAVQEYLARTVTTQAFSALQVESRLSDALDRRAPKLTFLAGPLANAVQGFVEARVRAIVSSQAFATLWEASNRAIHAQLIATLNGEGTVVQVTEGRVVLNLLPLVNTAIQSVSELATQLVGHPVTLPDISANEIPSEAVAKLEGALGVDLPERFGSITVYDSNDLGAVQDAIDLAGRLLTLLVVLFVLLFALALWASPRRRRTLIQLTAGLTVLLVIERRLAIAATNSVVDGARPENQAALRAVTDQVLGSLLRYTKWLLVPAVLTLLVALLSGPYPWAVRLRGWVRDIARVATGSVRGAERSRAAEWVAAHRSGLMLGGAAIAVIILLAVPVSFLGLLVLALLLAAYELVLYRVGTAVTDTELTPDGERRVLTEAD